LVEFKISGAKNDVSVQITADKPYGGISIGECVTLNKAVLKAIEGEAVIPLEQVSLEVSSPGLDRVLVTRQDFRRVLGQELHFWFKASLNGKMEAQGVLTEAGETALTIDVSGKTKLVLPLANIIKGLLVI